MASLRRALLLVLPLSLASTALLPSAARACGGTFCDNLPDPMPVDQRGEDILFVMDGQTVEVHVRIEYTGEAERFAWVLPLQAIPEIAVGSDPLFTALSQATGPSWTTVTNYDCPEDDPNWGDPTGGFSPKFDLGDTNDTGGPDVVFEDTVGAFEIVVLQGGTAAEVIDFLTANNYAQDPAAEPILQEYLNEGFLFAAVKLSAGVDVDQIHPLSFRFAGTEPCVPIRLTRIAAEDDMGIRAYFLAEDRWAPSTYAHVLLNPLAYNWQLFGGFRYLELLSMAVDEAGGRAFVTEYAGTPAIVSQSNIFDPAWDENAFLGTDPITAIQIIADQNLQFHPLIRGLLMEFIPPPDGLDAQTFWNNISDYADMIDLMAWDDVAFAAAIAERIIDPGFHATELLDGWAKLTRLHTTISPNEMTVDPVFVANAALPDVTDHRNVVTTEQVLCGGDQVFHVDVEGQNWPVCVPAGANYPGWDMPAALRVEQVPMVGPPQVSVDNTASITALYETYQSGVECLADGGGTGTSGDGDGDPTTTGPSTSGPGAEGESTGGPPYDLPYDVSCGCSSEGGQAPLGVGLGLLVLGLIGPWRRRD